MSSTKIDNNNNNIIVQATVSGRRILNSGTAGSLGKLNVDEGGAAVNATESKSIKRYDYVSHTDTRVVSSPDCFFLFLFVVAEKRSAGSP